MGIFNDDRKPYWPLIPILVAMVGLMVWMNGFMPPAALAPHGYSSVIVAMEFVFSPADVHAVLDPLSTDQIKGLDLMNKIDFGFMVLYSALIAGIYFITQKMEEGVKYLKIGMGLAGTALFSDLFENFELLNMTSIYGTLIPDEGYLSLISNLVIFTWLKWGSLAIAMALLVPILIRRGLFSKVIAFLLSLPMGLLIVVAFVQSSSMIDKFSSAVVLGFGALAVYVIAYRKPQIINKEH